MHPLLIKFINQKNSASSKVPEEKDNSLSGRPCIQFTYEEWLKFHDQNPNVLYLIKDYPSMYDISIGNISNEGDLSSIGKVFLGKIECMRSKGEELIDVLLRYGWNYITQIYHDSNFRDIVEDTTDPSNNGGNADSENSDKPLVQVFASKNEFPETGNKNKLYFDESEATLYSYSDNKYLPISEYFGNIIVDGNLI